MKLDILDKVLMRRAFRMGRSIDAKKFNQVAGSVGLKRNQSKSRLKRLIRLGAVTRRRKSLESDFWRDESL
jgi:DNA-binding Lrp family transcriptional regulator